MDNANRQGQTASSQPPSSPDSTPALVANEQAAVPGVAEPGKETCPKKVDGTDPAVILNCVRSGQIWVVNGRRRNGLILYKPFHAEFAGPGAAVGGFYDQDCHRVIPVGNFLLVRPDSHQERQNAYLIRRQWIKLTQQFTDQSVPLERAQMILNQFETYFDQQTIARVPDEAFAMMVGVLPYSVRMARRTPIKMNVKVKT
ncbi:MAG: hypothetical protein Kow00121_10360 [Elainellaceae cyanobacterium]